MSSTYPQPTFPTTQAIVWLTAAACLCIAGVSLVMPLAGMADSGSWRAMMIAGVLGWGMAVVSVLPVAVLGTTGVMPAVTGYFIGMGVRLAIGLGVFAWIAFHELAPTKVMAATLAAVYLPLLFIEVGLIGRYLWAWDAFSRQESMVDAGITEVPA